MLRRLDVISRVRVLMNPVESRTILKASTRTGLPSLRARSQRSAFSIWRLAGTWIVYRTAPPMREFRMSGAALAYCPNELP